MAGGFGINASYVWRRYDRFIWNDTNGITSADYSPVQFTPPAGACPADARCDAVTYYVPNVTLPSEYTVTTRPGLPPHLQRPGAGRPQALVAWLDAERQLFLQQHHRRLRLAGGVRRSDEHHRAQRRSSTPPPAAASVAAAGPISAGIPINAKWIAKLNGSYRLPFDVNVAATADMRQGYPFLQAINIAARPNRAPAVAVLLDPVGDVRFPDFATMDFRVDRTFTVGGGAKLLASFDMFNLFNANTVMGQRANQNAANANQVFGILAPRIARVGVMLTF